ncbi:MAG: cyclic nucleotide-binding domain-containing protein [Anaerolineae bacterium]
MDYLRFLKDTDIFYGMRTDHLNAICNICTEVEYEEGQIIVRENAPSDELYVIVEGRVDIIIDPSIIGAKGQRTARPTGIVTLRSGQTFGEIGLVDHGLRSASARAAATPTRLLAIYRKNLTALCESNYELGYHLMRNIASELAFKIRNTDLMLRERLLWEAPPSSIS